MHVRLLTPDDAPRYLELRREALSTEPLLFLSAPQDGIDMTEGAVRRQLARGPESVTFGCFVPSGEGALAGAVSLDRERKLKAAHRAHLWRLFVRREHRRRGAARALLARALDHARDELRVVQVGLCVSEAAEAAQGLYRSLGFRLWGIEPRWLRHAGREVALHHMVLDLDGGP